MTMGGDWTVALILLAVCLVVILTIAFMCRLIGYRRISSFFASGEEKAMLTKHEQHQSGYMILPSSRDGRDGRDACLLSELSKKIDTALFRAHAPLQEFLDRLANGALFVGENVLTIEVTSPPDFTTSGGYVQYDPVRGADQKYMHLPQTTEEGPPSYAAEPEEIKESPMSVDSMSIASDYEPPGGLHRAMSCESVASDSSVMDWLPEVPKIGQIEYGLEYDREVSELVISVIQARDLEKDELTKTLNSYVKVWLSPHKEGKAQTKVQKDTCDPVYKERFLFNVEPHELDNKVAQFQVYSSDKYARHKLLGETDLRLGDIDLRQPIRIWMNLRDMDEKPTDLGDIMFSLSYLPTAERLTIVIVKARNLSWTSGKDTGDCHVKVYLLQNGKRIGKKKTTTKRDEKNPIFNEAMIFSVPATALQTVQLRISMIEVATDGKSTSMGHVIVGSQLTGTELTHWNQMMTCLRKPVAMWHSLKK